MTKKQFTKTSVYISGVALSILFFWSCTKTENPIVNPGTSTISFVLANGQYTTIFHAAVEKAGLDSVFNNPTSIFTVLVPNDQACVQSGYPIDTINLFTADQARRWVLYQTYAGSVITLESLIGKTEEKLIMADGDSIFVTGDSNRTYVNGYQFSNSEISASNGLLIALANVLIPPSQNLAQMISTDTSLTFLNEAIQFATPVPDSLSVILANGGPFTFMAPVNDAFRNLGYNSPSDLSLANPDSLRSMILLGVIPQRLFSYDVADSSTFLTANDSTLMFTNTGITPIIQIVGSDTTSNVITSNQMAINGVLFKIDAILKP